MTKLTTNLWLILIILVTSITAVNAARIIDQMQSTIAADSTLTIGGVSEQKLAQTITISEDGILKGVFLPISCATGKLQIAITNVESEQPGNITFISKKIKANRITNPTTTFRYFALTGSLAVSTGDKIALVLANATGSCGLSRSPDGDNYLPGSGFFDARPNLPGWVDLSETETHEDLAFMLVIKTP